MVVTQVGRRRFAQRFRCTALAGFGAALLSLPAARADPLDVSVGLLSDKVVRGFSKTQGRASVEVDAMLRWDSGWFVAAGITDQRAGTPSGRAEILLSAGRSMPLSADWTLVAGVAHYDHVGRRTIDTDYTDFTLSLDWRGRGNLLLTLSPDNRAGRNDGRTAVVEAAWREPLGERWSIDAGVGRVDGPARIGYSYGSLGASFSAGPARVFATRVFSRAVASGALPASSQASRWVVAVLVVR